MEGTNTLLQVEGDHDNDWHVEVSTNLSGWTRLTNFGTLISGGKITNAPWRSVGTSTGALQFFRALKTDGLYDSALFRTVNLVFTQSNWPALWRMSETLRNTRALFPGQRRDELPPRCALQGEYVLHETRLEKSITSNRLRDTNANRMTTIQSRNNAAATRHHREPLYFNVMHHYAPVHGDAKVFQTWILGRVSLIQRKPSS